MPAPQAPLPRTAARVQADAAADRALASATEAQLNAYGYQLLNQKRNSEALAIFIRNTKEHPDSWNVWDSLGEYDLRERLHQLPHPPPALVVHGTYDPIPIASSRELALLLGAEFVELPVGHCPHVEATDAFVRALDRLTESLKP